MCHRWAFRKSINEKYKLSNKGINGIEHIIIEYKQFQKERNDLINELNKLKEKNKKSLRFSLVYCPPQGLIFNINNKKINPI